MSGGGSAPIRVAAAAIINAKGEMLLVRKRGSRHFMQPGGKIDAGETPGAALLRELREEIALEIELDALTYEGVFSEAAANEPGMQVVAEVFSVFADPEVTVQAEIAEAIWAPLEGDIPVLRAPLSEHQIFPVARERVRQRGTGAA